MSKIKDAKIAELKKTIAGLTSEVATARQLWAINYLSVKLGKEFSLPLTKHEASLIITTLKAEEWENDNEKV